MLPNRHTESHSKSGTAVSGAHHSARETMDGGLTDAMPGEYHRSAIARSTRLSTDSG
jgi:hypothetical protein